MISIVWPFTGTASSEQIEQWYLDALAKGRIPPGHTNAKDPYQMAVALDEIGVIRLHNVNHSEK